MVQKGVSRKQVGDKNIQRFKLEKKCLYNYVDNTNLSIIKRREH